MEQKEKSRAAKPAAKTGNTLGASPRDKKAGEAALHANHRRRVRSRFLEYGTEGMEDHQVLEMLLFYSIPRSDTNGLAHRLLNTFGSFSGVFDAPMESLMQVEGVGRETAIFLKLIPSVWGRYRLSEVSEIRTVTGRDDMEQVMRPMFTDKQREQLCCLFLDGGGRILKKCVYTGGSSRFISANAPDILRSVIICHAECVAIAHSHPGGYAAPSHDDIKGTVYLAEQLNLLGVKLLDHMIVAPNDVYFLSSCGKIPQNLFLLSKEE